MPASNNSISDGLSGERNVVLTGFGLFRGHELNPSWEAIRDDRLNIDRPNINIVKQQVDVAYEAVDKAVKYLWDAYSPIVMVHIGLAAHETVIRIEETARHGPYIHDDILKQAPDKSLREYSQEGDGSVEENVIKHNYTCKPCKFDSSSTCIDVDRICAKMDVAYSSGTIKLPYKKSRDAGLYVCEYIYQKSLNICDKTVFLHVPDVSNFPLDDITTALKHGIEAIIDEVVAMSEC